MPFDLKRSTNLAIALTSTVLFSCAPSVAAAANTIPRMPITFEQNQGQTTTDVKFISRGEGGILSLGSDEITLKSPGKAARFRMKLMGAAPGTSLMGTGESSGTVNYISGNDSSKWLTNIPSYTRVTYKSVYPHIDLVVYGNNGQFESDFILSKDADASVIDMKIDGNIEAGKDGSLTIKSADGAFQLHRPVVYQLSADGQHAAIDCKYTVDNGKVSFALGSYDHSKSLVIDPVLTTSTYFGGSGSDSILGISGDLLGNVYVTGQTSSLNFPTVAPYQAKEMGTTNCFVSKFDRTGQHLLYSTYLGGSGSDKCVGIAVNLLGEAFVAGSTTSTNFPTINAVQPTLKGAAGLTNGFVTHLNCTGSGLVFSTYLGGGGEFMGGIAVDLLSNVYVGGITNSPNFPVTKGSYQPTCGGCVTPNPSNPALPAVTDGFLTKLSPIGCLVYSTFLGGSSYDSINGVAVDTAGSAYVTGQTSSTNFPTVTPIQATNTSLYGNAFVTKFSPNGTSLVYSTYLGGQTADSGRAIDVDFFGNAYVTGNTQSTNFPVVNAYQSTYGAGAQSNFFVSKLAPTGKSFVYSTYLGGTGYDYPFGISVDLSGNAVVVGETTSKNFPTKAAIETTPETTNYLTTAVASFSSTGALNYSTYLGGNLADYGFAVYSDLCGNTWVGGQTFSSDFPTRNAYQATPGATESTTGDGFLTNLGVH